MDKQTILILSFPLKSLLKNSCHIQHGKDNFGFVHINLGRGSSSGSFFSFFFLVWLFALDETAGCFLEVGGLFELVECLFGHFAFSATLFLFSFAFLLLFFVVIVIGHAGESHQGITAHTEVLVIVQLIAAFGVG